MHAAWEEGSFTAAAERLGVGQATVSRRVAALEEHLGHVLFDRHRSGLRPTPAARTLWPRLEGLAAAADELAHALHGHEGRAEGVVRLTVAPGVAADITPALAMRLAQTHPDVVLDIVALIDPLDLDRREADIAIRSVPTHHGDLVSKRLGSLAGGLYATPSLIAALPASATAADVPLVGWSGGYERIALGRALAALGGPIRVAVNDYLVLREHVRAGVGASFLSDVEARRYGLERVPVELDLQTRSDIFRVVHRGLRHVPRVAVVIDAIDALAEDLFADGE